ncbi:hypothetical protein [Sediminicola luteus]|uniref:hypothetical protein n=1 Tax=Sediminicola luteus TaxID=319238 RepID=UPI001144D4C9|nr:hypothetical protein [Sediminicola luteus]
MAWVEHRLYDMHCAVFLCFVEKFKSGKIRSFHTGSYGKENNVFSLYSFCLSHQNSDGCGFLFWLSSGALKTNPL